MPEQVSSAATKEEAKPMFERLVTHEEAREAFMKYHNVLFNRAGKFGLHVPPQADDPDMILGDYIRQQSAESREPAEHKWISRDGFKWKFCEVCGIVRRADDKNKPCSGPAKLREMEKPIETSLPAAGKEATPAAQRSVSGAATIIHELKNGLASVGIRWIEPTDIRNQVGQYMLRRGVKMGVPVDPADMQEIMTDFVADRERYSFRKGMEEACKIADGSRTGVDAACAIRRKLLEGEQ